MAQFEKRNIELRYRLLAYIYSSVWKTCTTGAPCMRALVLDYPDDPNVSDLSTQYMFGKFLLVAPVLEEGFGDGSGEFTLTRYRCDRDSTGAITITLGRPERPYLISVNGDPLSEAGNKPDNWSLQKEGTLVIMVNGVKSETVVTCGLP